MCPVLVTLIALSRPSIQAERASLLYINACRRPVSFVRPCRGFSSSQHSRALRPPPSPLRPLTLCLCFSLAFVICGGGCARLPSAGCLVYAVSYLVILVVGTFSSNCCAFRKTKQASCCLAALLFFASITLLLVVGLQHQWAGWLVPGTPVGPVLYPHTHLPITHAPDLSLIHI